MIETIVWMFTIYCVANCGPVTPPKETNRYFNASSEEGCIEQANILIKQQGMSGKIEIECKPYKRTVTVRPSTGN